MKSTYSLFFQCDRNEANILSNFGLHLQDKSTWEEMTSYCFLIVRFSQVEILLIGSITRCFNFTDF